MQDNKSIYNEPKNTKHANVKMKQHPRCQCRGQLCAFPSNMANMQGYISLILLRWQISSGSVLWKMIVKTTKRDLSLHDWQEKVSRCMIFHDLVPVESVSQQTKKNWWWFLPWETFKGREHSSLVVTLVVILLKGLTVFEGWSDLRRGRIRPYDCQQRKSEIYDHFT